MNKSLILKKRFLLTSIILFGLSLTQKAYCTGSECADSILVLALGWAGVISGGAAISWLANPLLIFSWIFQKKNAKVSMFLSMFSFLLSLSFLMFGEVLDNEAGGKHAITGLKPGYWLWVGSNFVMLIGNHVLVYMENVKKREQHLQYKKENPTRDYLH